MTDSTTHNAIYDRMNGYSDTRGYCRFSTHNNAANFNPENWRNNPFPSRLIDSHQSIMYGEHDAACTFESLDWCVAFITHYLNLGKIVTCLFTGAATPIYKHGLATGEHHHEFLTFDAVTDPILPTLNIDDGFCSPLRLAGVIQIRVYNPTA